jgi:predicted small secreted protein
MLFIFDRKESQEMIKKIILIALLVVLSFSLISCQTVAGVGGDIKWSAEKSAEIIEGG